jgi:hypothetical protein
LRIRPAWQDGDVLRVLAIAAVAAVAAAWVGSADAAQLIDRDATGVRLSTNTKGEALLTYGKAGKTKRVLVWGALNAAMPVRGAAQVKFKVDYAGGWGKYHKQYWKTFKGTCGKYDGPPLPNVVAACKAFDGSYWAAQSWPRPLPNLGYTPWTAELRSKWLEVSHWSGDLPVLEVHQTWVWSQNFEQLFGRYTYLGQPIYGFGTTAYGAPTDNFGRLIYVDTLNAPKYGPGWRRENSFVPHNPNGVFCYGFYSFDPTKGGYKHPPDETARRGPGVGVKYRLTASGFGVMPNIEVTVDPLGAYDDSKAGERKAGDDLLRSYGDKSCLAGLTTKP